VSWWGVALAWSGWAVAAAVWLAVRRRLAGVADAEHELRGAATAIGLAAQRDPSPLVELELVRMGAALADLAEARGARPAAPPHLEAGRLAQVLGNVIANAAEHGVGPVEVGARREGGVVTLELSNEDGVEVGGRSAGRGRGRGRSRGRGILIAKRAARELGGRVSVEREGGVTRTVVELPVPGTPADSLPGPEAPLSSADAPLSAGDTPPDPRRRAA
jgi:signal transduction histidine kinase